MAQKLLNTCRELDPRLAGLPELLADGIFGQNTQRAVSSAKSALGITPANPVFDRFLWRPLADMAKWRIVDVCDRVLEFQLFNGKTRADRVRELVQKQQAEDPNLPTWRAELIANRKINNWIKDAYICRLQYNRFVAMGSNPISLKSKEQVYDKIRRGLAERSRDGWQVVLLRFTGHGSPGSQGVAGSLFGMVELTRDAVLMQEDDSDKDFIDAIMIGGMAMPMCPFGVIELHGCRIAGRSKARDRRRNRPKVDGSAFVTLFANEMARPVTAGTQTQYIGNAALDASFDGPTVTAIPGGSTIEKWFASR